MSNLPQILDTTKNEFTKLAAVHNEVNFDHERNFALMALKANNYLEKIALGNPDSLMAAVYQCASIGLSLNPAKRHAYLIPFKGTISLMPSYLGLIHLAISSGSVSCVHVDLVREKDTLEKSGAFDEPIHKRSMFGERGAIVGVYCVAKLSGGEFITTTMTIDEVYSIRDRSESFKKKAGPWVTDENEMIKKTVIRRAEKMWPKVGADRLVKAVEILNETEKVLEIVEPLITNKDIEKIRGELVRIEREEGAMVKWLADFFQSEIESLDDLTEKQCKETLALLGTWGPK